MNAFTHISTDEAAVIIAERDSLLIDIRDEQSFRLGHIKNAVHISNDNISEFISNSDMALPLIVYCYHGNSSQQAAAYLAEHGFTEVYSMDGGFEGWSASSSD